MAASNPGNKKDIIIHEDIIIHHILPKLPPKSLIRFRCVSKLWKSTIDDPNFTISEKHKTRALFISSTEEYMVLKNEKLSIPLRLEEPYAPLPVADISDWFGSCNGLVSFSVECDIFLWNPATSYCQKVLELDLLDNTVYDLVSGFCYDAATDDYVVLASFSHFSPGWNLPVISATLKSKRWRLVSFPFNVDSIRAEGPIVNNLLHWRASPEVPGYVRGLPNSIVYFDAPSNGFHKLPSPDPIDQGTDDCLVSLGVLFDCLCMLRWRGIHRGDIEVLVMKEYGVKESWTSMFCIPCQYKYSSWELLILCSWKLDIILFQRLSAEIHAYYPCTKTVEEVEVPAASEQLQWFKVIPYVEALVSPSGYYWNEESDKDIASTEALDYS